MLLKDTTLKNKSDCFYSLELYPLEKHHNQILKRMFDIIISILGIAIFLIPMLIIAVLIKLTSKGPVFYIQERVTKDNKVFNMYKFRTMVVNSEKDTGPVFAINNDPRCTTIGKFLRKTSLDELPQFFNVLKGDMSIVGPRPERPYFVEIFKQNFNNYDKRHLVKTGITGLAQINGCRGNTCIENRLYYDLYYIKNWSIFLDIKIILYSIPAIISDFISKNAY